MESTLCILSPQLYTGLHPRDSFHNSHYNVCDGKPHADNLSFSHSGTRQRGNPYKLIQSHGDGKPHVRPLRGAGNSCCLGDSRHNIRQSCDVYRQSLKELALERLQRPLEGYCIRVTSHEENMYHIIGTQN